jgi:hypothetical protein
MGGALGRSVTDYHKKMTFFNDASKKVFIREKGGSKQELNSLVTSCDKARRGGKIH